MNWNGTATANTSMRYWSTASTSTAAIPLGFTNTTSTGAITFGVDYVRRFGLADDEYRQRLAQQTREVQEREAVRRRELEEVEQNPILGLARGMIDEKAHALLKDVLTEEEYQGYLANSNIKIQGPEYCYEIRKEGRIQVFDKNGRWLYSLCVVSLEPLPEEDIVTAKVLLAKYDPLNLDKIGIKHDIP
jgi:hypothetical protein